MTWRKRMRLNYSHIAARIFKVPLMIHPGKIDAVIVGLAPRFGLPPEALPAPAAYDSLPGEKRKPGYRVHGSVGIIDIFGILTHRGSMEADSTYLLGYQDISQRLDAAVRDRGVQSIVLAIDSPGGEINGVYQLAEQIRRAATVKPVRAVIDGVGLSAAYLLAAAARDITATATSLAGSIGVLMRHVDVSAALAKEGVTVTQIVGGAHKVDGNPFEPLPVAVRERLQAVVATQYEQFVATVARYRNLDAAQVRGTQAQTYLGPEAMGLGLVDQMGTVDQVVADLIAATGSRSRVALHSPTQETMMDPEQKLFTQTELDKARADGHSAGLAEANAKTEAHVTEAHGKGMTDGKQQERTRITGIVGHAEAKDRTAQAIKIATTTDLSAEQAGAVMAGTPKETVAKGTFPSLAAAGNVTIGADAPAGDDTEEYVAAQRAVARLTGRPLQTH